MGDCILYKLSDERSVVHGNHHVDTTDVAPQTNVAVVKRLSEAVEQCADVLCVYHSTSLATNYPPVYSGSSAN